MQLTLRNDLKRFRFYVSDFVDGVDSVRSFQKSLATTIYLYFLIILPTIAFGVVDDQNTNGVIDVKKAIIGQTIGGLVFHLFAAQPLAVIATTAPLCLYTKVVIDIAEDLDVDFLDLFACVGFWNGFWVCLYGLFGVSRIMKYLTTSIEEIFAIFIFFAFSVDAIKTCVENFQEHYCEPLFLNETLDSLAKTMNESINQLTDECAKENSLLFLFLMLGTLWLACTLYNFRDTTFFGKGPRETVSDYALPLGVVFFSFVGSYLFLTVDADHFAIRATDLKVPLFKGFTITAVFVGCGLGFALSLLFFMDQNISAAMVNNPANKLTKGHGYDWDLLVVALLNVVTSLLGVPWMHGILPHSPLHARSLADVETKLDDGAMRDIVVRARETRVTGVAAHVLVGLSLLVVSNVLYFIPIPVLMGLFLYCAVASLRGNVFYERFKLVFTERSLYPQTSYVQKCPEKAIHTFTLLQTLQLLVLCVFGFYPWPYVTMAFPVIIAVLIPIRWFVIPKFVDVKYLNEIDGVHESLLEN